jgi:rfaE bifunctional protein kinase chain/domain
VVDITFPRIKELFGAFSKAKIAVLGDLMLDRYFFGSVTRISPEAPVPVVDIEQSETRLGGAANVGHNIHTLSATPILIGVVGDDNKGNQLRSLLTDIGLSADGIITDPDRPTTIKTRVVADSKQVLRIDQEKKHTLSLDAEERVMKYLASIISSIDAIIFEDYNKGVLSRSLISRAIDLAQKNNVKTFVDPKFDNFFEYKKTTVFKPNRKELQDALGVRLRTDEDINAAGFKLLSLLEAENVLLTLSEKGMRLFERGHNEPFSIPTMAREVADVSGAGDTVVATLAVACACGASVREAAVIANRAAGLVVEELGIEPIRKENLLVALEEDLENNS